jgi:hypothetical protein
MKKRKIIATSSIAVALFLSSYASGQAADYSFLKPNTYLEAQSAANPEVGTDNLGISARDYREELGVDPTFMNSLVDQGFNPSQIQKIFTSASLKTDYNKLPLSE